MIKFSLKDSIGEIDQDFNVSFEDKDKQDLLQKIIDVFLADLKPSSGDPFFLFAEELENMGFEIKKVVPQNEGKEMIY